MNLSEVLEKLGMYLDTSVEIEVIRRCANGVVTHKANVPISHIKPDFDDQGIKIRIEESDIVMEEYN